MLVTADSPAGRLVCDSLEPPPAGYEPIDPAVMRRLNRWDIDLFIEGGQGGAPVLLRDAATEVADARIERLIEKLDQRVFVRTGDFNDLSGDLLADIDAVAEDSSLPALDRFALLQTAAAAEVEVASTLIDPTRFLRVTEKLGKGFTSLIESGDIAPAEVYRVARHDQCTFTHITNVCCYSLVLADSLGMSDRAELEEFAVGALVHDTGKRHIPGALLRKQAPLTAEERSVIREHPQRGYEDLVQRPGLSEGQLMMVYQHHEWVAGGGYPVGVSGAEIHPWAKLLAVVDVFEALTGRRPYRKPMTAEAGLRYLSEYAGEHFDPEVVRCWTSAMQKT